MLTMYKYETGEGSFFMESKITNEEDAVLFQRIFRDAIQVKMSTESTFGLDEDFEEFLEMSYPRDHRFRLTYESEAEGASIKMILVNSKGKSLKHLPC